MVLKVEIKVSFEFLLQNKLEIALDYFLFSNQLTIKMKSSRRKRFSCDECGNSYSMKYTLESHVKAVHCGEMFSCDKCDKSYTTSSGLINHVNSIHSGKKFVCPECPGSSFSRNWVLKEHTESFHQNRTFKCQFCDYKNHWRYEIRRHTRVRHTEAGLHENIYENVESAVFTLKLLRKLQAAKEDPFNISSAETIEREFYKKHWRFGRGKGRRRKQNQNQQEETSNVN